MLRPNATRGFTVLELVIALIVAATLSALAIPTVDSAMTSMRLNATATAVSAALSNARYRTIKDSQVYTITFTTPANTYVVKNIGTNVSDSAVPLPNPSVTLNGGGNANYTFTLCPNGMVYGAGGACPGTNAPPVLAAVYKQKEIDVTMSGTGNVTTSIVH